MLNRDGDSAVANLKDERQLIKEAELPVDHRLTAALAKRVPCAKNPVSPGALIWYDRVCARSSPPPPFFTLPHNVVLFATC
jgi:hypothetical protein